MFNECLKIRWKTVHFCILNFFFLNHFVCEVISSIRHSVSSRDETLRSSSKMLRCASYFQLSSQCFIWWWNTASHVWYITCRLVFTLYKLHRNQLVHVSFIRKNCFAQEFWTWIWRLLFAVRNVTLNRCNISTFLWRPLHHYDAGELPNATFYWRRERPTTNFPFPVALKNS